MGNTETIKRYGALILGSILATFSVGRFNIPLFIFLWPMLYLYYIRHAPSKTVGMFSLTIAILVVNWLKWQGFSHESIAWDMAWASVQACYQMIPFLIEACVSGYIPETYDILLYPFAEAAIEFMVSFVPKANNNLFAYSMQNNLLLIQCLSLFGTFFLSFLLALFNTVFYYGIKVFLQFGRISKWIFSYIAIFVVLEIYGAIYIQVLPDYTKKMKIAMVPGISNIEYNKELPDTQRVFGGTNFVNYIQYMRDIIDYTISFKIDTLFVAEEAFQMYKSNVNGFVKAINQMQVDANSDYSYIGDVYINVIAGTDTSTKDDKNFYNELVVSPWGNEPYIYTKVHPIPITEDGYRRGRSIHTTPMYYGRGSYNEAKVGSVICYDVNFPHFMNWIAFKEHPDIIFVGSWDYEEVSIFQSYVTAFRSIENGYSIVKNTIGGITIITDFCGRFLEYYKVKQEIDDYLVIASVWGNGRTTLYSIIGIFWNYFYILGVFVVAVRGYFVQLDEIEKRQRLKTRSSNLPTESQRLATTN